MASSQLTRLLLIYVLFMLGSCKEISRETKKSLLNLSGVTCGHRPLIDNRNKIVGGRNSNRGAEPWQANLLIDISPQKDMYGQYIFHLCGATIISEYWILTAAHCLIKEFNITVRRRREKTIRISESNYFVVVGDYDQYKSEDEEEKFERLKFIPHEDFSDTAAKNDIALLRILPKDGRGIKFTDYVQPACLPNAETPYTPGEECIISGWGITDIMFDPPIVQSAVIPIIKSEDCVVYYQNVTNLKFDADTMMCAGFAKGGIGVCQGDSGGALACYMNGSHTVLGLVSFSVGCARPNFPGVYTRVQSYLDWIDETIQKHGC